MAVCRSFFRAGRFEQVGPRLDEADGCFLLAHPNKGRVSSPQTKLFLSRSRSLSVEKKKSVKALSKKYESFETINGNHSLREAIPDGYVDYPVRTRQGGSVFYFNFDLARDMGLIDRNHPDEMTPQLRDKILETFTATNVITYDSSTKRNNKLLQISEKLIQVATSDNEDIVSAAYKWVTALTWENICKEWTSIFQQTFKL